MRVRKALSYSINEFAVANLKEHPTVFKNRKTSFRSAKSFLKGLAREYKRFGE
jgi:hypothetical protein